MISGCSCMVLKQDRNVLLLNFLIHTLHSTTFAFLKMSLEEFFLSLKEFFTGKWGVKMYKKIKTVGLL